MSRRRRGRSFGLPNWVLIVVFVFALMLLRESGEQKQQKRQEIDRKIDTSVAKERNEYQSSKRFGGNVFLYKSRRRFTETMVHSMARSKSQDHISIWTVGGDENAFATAPGVDRIHHFVNAYLEGYEPFKTDNIMIPLYTLARQKTYQFDHLDVTGHQELWQTSKEAFYYKRGDCEDHAIALADWLIEMGEDARVVSGDYRGEGHAWVALFKSEQVYLLESTDKRPGLRKLSLASMHPEYHPRWMFNREFFWYNTGSSKTVRYFGNKWKKTSRYEK